MWPTFLGAPDSWHEDPPFGRVTEGSGRHDATGAGGWRPTTELPSRASLAGGTPLVVYRQPLPCSRPPLPESTPITIERPRRIAISLLPHPPWRSKASRVRDRRADATRGSLVPNGASWDLPFPHLFVTEKGTHITEGTLRHRL